MSLRDEMERRIRAKLPDAEIELNDMTGGGDHWQAVIISSAFEGKTTLMRQRAVFEALGELMHGPIHAFTVRTLTPAQAGRTE
jgi:stress-induced morphogen